MKDYIQGQYLKPLFFEIYTRSCLPMHRHVRQSIDEEVMKEIVQIVRTCGYDFEGNPEMLDQNTAVASFFDGSNSSPACGEDGSINKTASVEGAPDKKRRRDAEPEPPLSLGPTYKDIEVGEPIGNGVDLRGYQTLPEGLLGLYTSPYKKFEFGVTHESTYNY